jgi:hypothetical protein
MFAEPFIFKVLVMQLSPAFKPQSFTSSMTLLMDKDTFDNSDFLVT